MSNSNKLEQQQLSFSHETHYKTYEIDCVYCHVKALNAEKANLPTLNNCLKCHDYARGKEEPAKTEINKLIKLRDSKREVSWNTAYRLPDHVHFDHGLHMQASNLSCLECHPDEINPAISENAVRMTWCVDCHLQQKLNMKLNYYKQVYDTTFQNNPMSVAKNGGLNCTSCHY